MQIVTPTDVKKLGTILSVWAHPDDESFLAGGVMAAAVQNGQQVICVTATKGEAGVQDESRWPAAQLGAIRAEELQAALQKLGISSHHWLDYRDGECAGVPIDEAVQKIVTYIEQYRPDTILTFGPDGLTGHPDHQTVSRWVTLAATQTQNKPNVYQVVCSPEQYERYLKPLDEQINLFFNIDRPPLIPENQCAIAFELPADVLAKKVSALAAMPSQMERLLACVPQSDRQGTFGREYFVLAQ